MSTVNGESFVRLPPLVVDGAPKSLHSMTVRELNLCLAKALKVCSPKVRWSKAPFSWWPSDIPKNLDFSGRSDRSTSCRRLLQACYEFYDQTEILHLFDPLKDGESPTFRMIEYNGTYTVVVSLISGCVLAKFVEYDALPLAALDAKLNGVSSSPGNRKRKTCNNNFSGLTLSANLLSEDESDQTGTAYLKDLSLRIPRFDDVVVKLKSLDDELQVHSHKKPKDQRITLNNDVTKQCSGNVSKTDPKCDGCCVSPSRYSFVCCLCNKKSFFAKSDLLCHMIVCDRRSDDPLEDRLYLYRNFNLVPKETLESYETSMAKMEEEAERVKIKSKKEENVDLKQFASLLPLSSALGRKLLAQYKCDDVKNAKFSFFEHGAFESGVHNRSSAFSEVLKPTRFFPIVYKSQSSNIYSHTYSFTQADRRNRAKQLFETSRLTQNAKRLLKQCKPCFVAIKRLDERVLNKYNVNGGSATTRWRSGRLVRAGGKTYRIYERRTKAVLPNTRVIPMKTSQKNNEVWKAVVAGVVESVKLNSQEQNAKNTVHVQVEEKRAGEQIECLGTPQIQSDDKGTGGNNKKAANRFVQRRENEKLLISRLLGNGLKMKVIARNRDSENLTQKFDTVINKRVSPDKKSDPTGGASADFVSFARGKKKSTTPTKKLNGLIELSKLCVSPTLLSRPTTISYMWKKGSPKKTFSFLANDVPDSVSFAFNEISTSGDGSLENLIRPVLVRLEKNLPSIVGD